MAALSGPDEDDGSMTRHRAAAPHHRPDASEPLQTVDMVAMSTPLAPRARPLPTPPPPSHQSSGHQVPTITPSRPPPPPPPSRTVSQPGLTASSSGRRVASARFHECTHTILVRMYSRRHPCECCNKLPPEGYLFRCAQDHELILADLVRHNEHSPFDQLGHQLAALVKPPKRGAELRAAAVSRSAVLGEMTAAEAASYTDPQIEKLVAQREHALRCAKEDTFRALFPRTTAFLYGRIQALVDPSLGESAWVPRKDDECRLSVCRRCRPYYAERCYMSLGGIANDDVPATAALGFGFHMDHRRPVIDTAMARNLGLADASEGTNCRRGLSTPPSFDLMDLIEAHLGESDVSQEPVDNVKSPSSPLVGSRRATPRSIVHIRDAATENTPAGQLAAHGSPNSTPLHKPKDNWRACVPTQLWEPGPPFPPSREPFDRACRSPLPRPDREELVAFGVDSRTLPAVSIPVQPVQRPPRPCPNLVPKTEMELKESMDGVFGAEPLLVPGGVALTEEAVETGIADVSSTIPR